MDIKTSNKFFYDKIGEVHQRDGGMLIGINFPQLKINKKHPTRSRNQNLNKNISV